MKTPIQIEQVWKWIAVVYNLMPILTRFRHKNIIVGGRGGRGVDFASMHNNYLNWTPMSPTKNHQSTLNPYATSFSVTCSMPHHLNMPSLVVALRSANHFFPMFAARKFCISSDVDEYDENITHSDTSHRDEQNQSNQSSSLGKA